jgi:hypothetical protein
MPAKNRMALEFKKLIVVNLIWRHQHALGLMHSADRYLAIGEENRDFNASLKTILGARLH